MALAFDDMVGGFEVLDEEECLDLLSQGWLGRVAVSMGSVPAIFPVNYFAEAGAIYFLTGEGTKLSAALRSAVVSFEVDAADPVRRTGWSVLAVGEAHEVTEPAVVRSVLAQLEPWAPGERRHVVRIWPDFVSGRRIAFGRTGGPAPAAPAGAAAAHGTEASGPLGGDAVRRR